MSNKNNVVDFNEALKKAEEQEHKHDQACPHCEFLNYAVENFNRLVNGMTIGSDEFNQQIKIMISFVQDEARKNTLGEIAHGLIQEIEEMEEEEFNDED